MPSVTVKLPTGPQAMDVDEYVKNVVPAEMPSSWHMEALKAQAVAAKSYAVSEGTVEITDHSQVYDPSKRAASSDAAVEAVRDVYMAFGGRIVTTFFFASCTGRTRTPSQASWNPVADRPFLQPVSCTCRRQTYDGPGIGLCQNGAQAMALAGATFDQILRHYYTGIQLVHADGTPVAGLSSADVTPPATPAASTATTTALQPYTVQSGDTLGSIAHRFNIEWAAIFQANTNLITDPNRIELGWVLQIPVPVVTYVVVSGDTLGRIAGLWNCTVDAICALNGIADPNRIEVGQVLKRP